jgi:hypothetical protein
MTPIPLPNRAKSRRIPFATIDSQALGALHWAKPCWLKFDRPYEPYDLWTDEALAHDPRLELLLLALSP